MTNGNTYVKWSVMSILLTILIIVMGVFWTEIKSVRDSGSETKEDVAQIKTDVEWIKNLIQRGEISFIRK